MLLQFCISIVFFLSKQLWFWKCVLKLISVETLIYKSFEIGHSLFGFVPGSLLPNQIPNFKIGYCFMLYEHTNNAVRSFLGSMSSMLLSVFLPLLESLQLLKNTQGYGLKHSYQSTIHFVVALLQENWLFAFEVHSRCGTVKYLILRSRINLPILCLPQTYNPFSNGQSINYNLFKIHFYGLYDQTWAMRQLDTFIN